MCLTTSATTPALSIVGAPTENLPSLATKRTRSKVTSFPSSASNNSTSIVSPGDTRYCLLPVSMTAYIKPFPKRDGDSSKTPEGCQQTISDFERRKVAEAGREANGKLLTVKARDGCMQIFNF